MKLLWLFCALQVVFGQTDFGNAYLKRSELCRSWNCINTNLGFPDTLPLRQDAEESLRRVLPQEAWQNVLGTVLDTCYCNRTRRYTNTCPGQALLHCVVDQMINNCPEDFWRKDDACAPISSLAGLKFMFTQSRYNDMEKNLRKERRPKWFMKDYFDQKCCDLPPMFNSSLMSRCGFSTLLRTYSRGPQKTTAAPTFHPTPSTQSSEYNVRVMLLNTTTTPVPEVVDSDNTNPLACCDMSEFIQPSWTSECGFQIRWQRQSRLVITNETKMTPKIPISKSGLLESKMLLPHSCEQEICVFKKLGVVDDAGLVNSTAYWNMLNSFTAAHPTWERPAGRVVAKCLTRTGSLLYEAGCEINKLLACTFDVLTEYCPYRRVDNDCRSNKCKSGCLISSSKLRLKSRREVCLIPPLVNMDLLSECGLASLYHVETVVWPVSRSTNRHCWYHSEDSCQEPPSTKCLMDKMGILSRYNIMDYFAMKDRIRNFTANQTAWSAMTDTYLSSLTNLAMYPQLCSSHRKLMNVIDYMLMTCPLSKRQDSPQCKQFFKQVVDAPLNSQTTIKQHGDLMEHFSQYVQKPPLQKVQKQPVSNVMFVKKSDNIYDKLINSKKTTTAVIDIEPVIMSRLDKPLVLAPVYMRVPTIRKNNPYWLHERVQIHTTTPASDIIYP